MGDRWSWSSGKGWLFRIGPGIECGDNEDRVSAHHCGNKCRHWLCFVLVGLQSPKTPNILSGALYCSSDSIGSNRHDAMMYAKLFL
ncbi:hypothetical protein PHYBLDRAFT_144521 [Phycomyces blakesleeanus NRRL 1555(-)]|uniref:Uncharacterized protein n=1 Tax=Phycomyces blakesleeanus (strain ATCC 8743b / DSM 1359 / FGSC 10004 / NBRC 33097 / NRRL 1555) TaxID=763407 RepID=A0A167N6W0_PHYB8|nr:hypothetical protein PHYBLDRAFT_144521 [Phycomyces blakesleeanus NRRL 1555(-)]OAD75174.1 hypothetical protein PHYBLDRAFT_144521 [Phycomyces blakesleeanus NRRL 1555(-)]|eukprot:XP_018293214.1 hypothetical protein PHYBLDRAFT_144521 [Phycomyces blakesleeanus NRRL 1555(-)]